MDVVVTGIGLRSPLGCLSQTWKHLLAGKTGITLHQPFAELSPRPLAMLSSQPTALEDLTRQVVEDALQDAGLSPPLLDCGVVVGSSRGNQAKWERLSRQMLGRETQAEMVGSSLHLADWLNTLPQTAAIAAARMIGTTATVLSPMAACATGLWAIAQGALLIQAGACERVLAGAVETPITPLTLTGFQQMGALATTGAYPFDRDREGLVLAEGGAVLVLEAADRAIARHAKIYGRIGGWGLTADGYHVSAPDPHHQGAIAAIQQALQRSHLSSAEIDYIHAHGTATRLNDANEAAIIRQLFPATVPVSSTKGATGHAIGASGAIGAAVCLMARQQNLLPPSVGLRQPEFDLNFVRVTIPRAVRQTLCLSFGFGGQNAALVIDGEGQKAGRC